jgi:GTP cyclohydrolase IB
MGSVPNVLEDVQNHKDQRGISIDQVGVSELRYPITVMDPLKGLQTVTASIKMSVGLPHNFKGTHMSRFIEVLNRHQGEVTMKTLPNILQDLKTTLDADSARIEVDFPYFIERKAPLSGAKALMDYECTFIGDVNCNNDDFILGVRVPVSSLCPCSKAISDYGAHNQRGYINIKVRSYKGPDGYPKIIWLEELIEIAEKSASAPVYPLLKRPDERHVTMQAYDNPVFVEDMIRNAANLLREDKRLSWFCLHVVNMESIHNHNAFAKMEWSR